MELLLLLPIVFTLSWLFWALVNKYLIRTIFLGEAVIFLLSGVLAFILSETTPEVVGGITADAVLLFFLGFGYVFVCLTFLMMAAFLRKTMKGFSSVSQTLQ